MALLKEPNPTIVVLAFNRPAALQRLLASLATAEYPPDTRLIISIDFGGKNGRTLPQIATDFHWPFGPKEILIHKSRLGLVNHVFFAGDLSQKFGGVILLEDDLVVSPMFYHFASQSLQAYGADPAIAGIALNSLWFNGVTHQPFIPYLDDSDSFFMQVSWYQGMAFTAAQWADFMIWRETASRTITPEDGLHKLFMTFPETDWFPFMMKYLRQSGRSYAFPRESLTTNFGDAGTHFKQATPFFQVPLQTRRRDFRLQPFADSIAVYDSFQEILPERLNRLTDQFTAYNYAVDLYGTKSRRNLQSEYVLTSRPCRRALYSFGQVMWPHEANVITAVPGSQIHFAAVADVQMGRWAQLATAHQNHDYFNRHRRLTLRQRIKLWLGQQWPG